MSGSGILNLLSGLGGFSADPARGSFSALSGLSALAGLGSSPAPGPDLQSLGNLMSLMKHIPTAAPVKKMGAEDPIVDVEAQPLADPQDEQREETPPEKSSSKTAEKKPAPDASQLLNLLSLLGNLAPQPTPPASTYPYACPPEAAAGSWTSPTGNSQEE
ncbi:MAG: hypothetical protein Q4B50_08210, partial [Bacillota bacterium]|nr:hypothetical protein [Bacillota bacterium]